MEAPKVKITPVQTDTDPPLTIYQVEMENDQATWPETFGTPGEVNAFLRGVKACASFTSLGFLSLPEVGPDGTVVAAFGPVGRGETNSDRPAQRNGA